MSKDQLETVNQLIRKLDDEAAAAAQPVRNPARDAEYLRLALGGMEPLAAQPQSRWARLKEQLFATPGARWQASFLVAAAAMAMVVMVARPSGMFNRTAALPKYELSVSGDAKVLSSSAAPGSQVRLDSTLFIQLRPEKKVKSAVEPRAFQVVAGAVKPWDVRMQRADSGSGTFQLRDTPRNLGLTVGTWDLLFVVGPPDELPNAEQIANTLSDSDSQIPHKWQSLRQRVEIVSY